MSVRMLKFKVTPYGTFSSGQVVAGLPPHLEYQLMESGDAVSADVADFADTLVGAGNIFSGSRIRSSIVSQRIMLSTGAAAAAHTMGMMRRAPGHFDHVRMTILGLPAGAANAHTASFAPSALPNNGYVPVDASSVEITPTAFTWGSTDPDDYRNPGGGSANTQMSGGSGASGTDGGNLIEGFARSDWLAISSLNRADDASLPPLYVARLHSAATPAVGFTDSSSASSNPWSSSEPDFFSGYFGLGVDHTLNANPGAAPTQGWVPSIELEFVLRGARGISIVGCGDSLMKGFVQATAVPQWGGGMDGWCRKLARKLSDAGIPTGFNLLAYQGFKSLRFHDALYSELLRRPRAYTHAFIMPWSTNESGDGTASWAPARQRTTRLIEMCQRRGVVPIVVQLWPGMSYGTPVEIAQRAYCDQLRAAGVRVFDARSVVNSDPTATIPSSGYLTRTAGGAVVDNVHINEAAHDAIANEAMRVRDYLGLI